MSKTIDTIPSETMNVLVRYQWPGNIRELQNLLERAGSQGPAGRHPDSAGFPYCREAGDP
jgi:formate hydrogenlyase transcriptional activator